VTPGEGLDGGDSHGLRRDLLFVGAARLVTAVLSVAGLALVGLWSGATALGELTRQLAISLLALTALVQWLKSIITRHWQTGDQPHVATLVRRWLVATTVTTVGASVALGQSRAEIAVIGLLALVHVLLVGAHEIALEVDRATLRLRALAAGQIVRGVAGFLILICLTAAEVRGLYLAVAWPAAAVAPLALTQRYALRHVILDRASYRPVPSLNRQLMIRYGFAAALSATLGTVIVSADRLLIAALVNIEVAGVYALAYDLGHESTFAIGTIVNQIGFPRVVAFWERKPPMVDHVKALLTRLEGWIFLGGGVACASAALLGGSVAGFIAPNGYEDEFFAIFASSALLGVVLGLKSFILDVPILLARRNGGLVLSLMAAATCNVLVGWPMVRWYGLNGAILASATAYAVAIVGSEVVSRRIGGTCSAITSLNSRGLTLVLLGLTVPALVGEGLDGWRIVTAVGCLVIAGSVLRNQRRSESRLLAQTATVHDQGTFP